MGIKSSLAFLILLLSIWGCTKTTMKQTMKERKIASTYGSAPTMNEEWWEERSWKEEQSRRDLEITNYNRSASTGYNWFHDWPVGQSGIPMILFRVFPEVFPELWGGLSYDLFKRKRKAKSKYEDLGFFKKTTDRPVLPHGLAWGEGSKKLLGLRAMGIVTLSCAGCHTGRVQGDFDGDGKEEFKILHAGPSTTFDVHAYRDLVEETLLHPNYNVSNFKAAIEKAKKKGGSNWLYRKKRYIGQSKLDHLAFSKKPQLILDGIKYLTIANKWRYDVFLKPNYGPIADKVDGGNPGGLEAFGIAAAKFISCEAILDAIKVPEMTYGPEPLLNCPKTLYELYKQGRVKEFVNVEAIRQLRNTYINDILVNGYHTVNPSQIDIMSVWNQKSRGLAQWDGNLRDKLARNIGAEMGVIGNPALINFQNAVETTDYVERLPAPVYPFGVKENRLVEGRDIFLNRCASCHSTGRDGNIEKTEVVHSTKSIGTDKNRAYGLTARAALELDKGFKIACELGKRNLFGKISNFFWSFIYEQRTDQCDFLVYPEDTKFWDVEGESSKDIPKTLIHHDPKGYLAPALDGIWARAPYLHNGSVPTLYHLLTPSERPASFRRGNLRYDQKHMGFEWRRGGKTTFDTSQPGLSNKGHELGSDLSRSQKMALIEYLKTL